MKTIYYKLLFLTMLLSFSGFAQSTVEGIVVDSKSSKPIAGVNVVVKGGSSVSTQDNGAFKLIKVNRGDKITFSFVGYQTQSIEYTGQKSLTVLLAETSNTLEAVTVQVGYGSVKKKDLTGSVAVVTSKDFNKGAITSVDGLLNGRAAGVVVTGSGTPGNDATIRVRGTSTLNASNDPLVVVDGMPINGGLASINPNDIESFSILKDASSTAIYGNRGANGVILITTKSGTSKFQVNFNSFVTLNTLQKEIKVYGADEFRNLINTYAPLSSSKLSGYNTDWQKEIFRNSFTSDVNAQVMGSMANRIPARLSVSHTENNGILLTSRASRTTTSFALNPSFFKSHLKISLNSTYNYTARRNADEGAIGNAISSDPTRPVYSTGVEGMYAGYTEWINSSNSFPTGAANPVSQLLEKADLGHHDRFIGNFNVDYKFHFLPELRAIVNGGIENLDGTQTIYTNPLSRGGFQSFTDASDVAQNLRIGYYETKWYKERNKNLNAQLNYSKKFGKLSLEVLAGHEYFERQKSDYHSGNLNSYSYLSPTQINAIADTYTDPGLKLESYLGRANFGWNDKYLFTFNFRRDGSSRISPNNKWANFMGYAFAWKLHEEAFLKNSKTVSELKLRLGYGQNGNQDIGAAMDWFKRYTTSASNFYQFGSYWIPISKPVGYNENLKWERTTKYNVGLDFGLFNNRLKGSIDGYVNKTKDLFATVSEGALQNLRILGLRNVGSLESKGAELNLNYNVIKKENLDLNFNYNASYNKVTITDLFSDDLSVGGVGLGGFVQTLSIGYSPYAFKVYQQVYDQNGHPIQGVYVDRNKDGVIDSKDKYVYKKPQAPVTMGFMVNATIFKNIDYSMAWRSSIGNYIYDQINADRAQLGGINNTVSGTLSNSPVDFSNTLFTNTVKESDYYVKNGSFLKWDNVTIGYKFTKSIKGVKSLRLYTGIQNVLIITKYKNLDPEVFNNGMDNTIYPRARMYMLGLNVNL